MGTVLQRRRFKTDFVAKESRNGHRNRHGQRDARLLSALKHLDDHFISMAMQMGLVVK
jgi:hypothetical protein